MNETLLQYIWQYQLFSKEQLKTSDDQILKIIKCGNWNKNQGPDFLQCKISLNDTIWAGNIEIHIKSSDWHLHAHSNDSNYKNVILHVVWEMDDKTELPFPTLELKTRVPKLMLRKYKDLMEQNKNFIPCEEQIHLVDDFIKENWISRMTVERMEEKGIFIHQQLHSTNNNLEESFWRILAKNFGYKVNADAFFEMANQIPFNIFSKIRNSRNSIEALLIGQCGMLEEDFEDDYPRMLKKEYEFLKKKYSLPNNIIPVQYLRMRPANFPAIRLSQLASILHQTQHLFSKIIDTKNFEDLYHLFDEITPNDYWLYHYKFDSPSDFKIKKLGKQMIHNIFINSICPFLFNYGNQTKNENLKERAIQWLEKIEPEKNTITAKFQELGMPNKFAFHSQGLLHLKKNYCDLKNCLQCGIGIQLLKGNSA